MSVIQNKRFELKILISIIFTVLSSMNVASEVDPLTDLFSIKGYKDNPGNFHYIVFEDDIVFNYRIDDDIYFQNGRLRSKEKVNFSEAFCFLDSDINNKDIGYQTKYLKLTNTQLIIEAGFQIPIYHEYTELIISENIAFYAFKLRPEGRPNLDILDHLKCFYPPSLGFPTVGDITKVLDGALSFHY